MGEVVDGLETSIKSAIGTPTFANPTQQPLRLAGTLATAAEHKIDNSRPLDVTVPELFSAGFDTVLVCALDHAPDIPGATKSVEGTGWAIYRPLGQ